VQSSRRLWSARCAGNLGGLRLVSEGLRGGRASVPRRAVWLKQNCGVRRGAGDGCDMVCGDGLGEREGGGEAGFQKYFARLVQFYRYYCVWSGCIYFRRRCRVADMVMLARSDVSTYRGGAWRTSRRVFASTGRRVRRLILSAS
jgi:hypothetical protein